MGQDKEKGHHWRFHRLGGFAQVRLETAEDLRHLAELDQKLWAALSCPVHGLECDPKTLELLDTDQDGQVRAPELLSAVAWCCRVLNNLELLLDGRDALPLEALNQDQEEGRQLHASALQLLAYRNKEEAGCIAIEDVAEIEVLLHESRFNGDGIVPVHAAEDEPTRLLLTEILACMGSDEDRSGAPGISRERMAAFFTAAADVVNWAEQPQVKEGLTPLGEHTLEGMACYQQIRAKIEDYFIRCDLAAYDVRAEDALNPSLQRYEQLAAVALARDNEEVAVFPLAHVNAAGSLPLATGINPAWAEPMAQFVCLVVRPLVGEVECLEYDQWQQIKTTLAACEQWLAEKPGTEVERLGLDRLQAILASDGQSRLETLITQDLAPAAQIERLVDVVRLVYFNRDLYRLLNNFVSFYDFYAQQHQAVFQAGRLYLDGRACELCLPVGDIDSHSQLAALSRIYLAYCTCRRRGSGEQMVIAAAFTAGHADNLRPGRNGVFYDRQGRDWDATIRKIIEHPISVSQAFWAPYKRVGRMIGEQLEKFAAAKDKEVATGTGTEITQLERQVKRGKAEPAAFDVGKFAGIFAAIGLAIGAIGTAIASVIGGFFGLPLWEMPLAFAGIILFISGPSMLMAYLKLRQRTLGPLLDANGWAVNAKAAINLPFGATLTTMAVLPKGAEQTMFDPYAEKKLPWKRWLCLLLLLLGLAMAWHQGALQHWLGQVKPVLQQHGLFKEQEGTQDPTRSKIEASRHF